MKGFDDHLDNYGNPNPGDNDFTSDSETAEILADPDTMAAIEEGLEDEEPPFEENHYRYHTPAGPNPACPNCRWLNWQQADDDGITADDFDNWPREREFPS